QPRLVVPSRLRAQVGIDNIVRRAYLGGGRRGIAAGDGRPPSQLARRQVHNAQPWHPLWIKASCCKTLLFIGIQLPKTIAVGIPAHGGFSHEAFAKLSVEPREIEMLGIAQLVRRLRIAAFTTVIVVISDFGRPP